MLTLEAKRPEELPANPVDVVTACSLRIKGVCSELRLIPHSLHKISLAYVKVITVRTPRSSAA
jgi:hypothetical protein